MTQTLDVIEQLNEDERRKVRAYAESLLASRRAADRPGEKPRGIDVDGLLGMFEGMGGDKSDKQLIREAWDEIAAKYD